MFPFFRRRSNNKPNVQNNLHIEITSWTGKEGKPTMPYLLAAINLEGDYADAISSSTDFTLFETVDNNGQVYLLKLLQNITY